MAKSIKLKNNYYIDSTGVIHNKKTLNNYIRGNSVAGGNPIKCGYQVDGKDVYVKRLSVGNLPNVSSKEVDTGVLNANMIDIKGQIIPLTGNQSPFPYNNPNTGVYGYYNGTTGKITVYTLSNRSDNTCYLDFYYTLN